MDHIHEKREPDALWVQYNDLIVPFFRGGISTWIDNGARAAGVQRPGVLRSMPGNDRGVKGD